MEYRPRKDSGESTGLADIGAARTRDNFFDGSQAVIPLTEKDGVITFAIRVQPRAKRSAITGELGNVLKLSTTAPPVDGKANEACVDLLAKLLKVPKSSVSIAAGLTSRNKLVRVTGLSSGEVMQRLGI